MNFYLGFVAGVAMCPGLGIALRWVVFFYVMAGYYRMLLPRPSVTQSVRGWARSYAGDRTDSGEDLDLLQISRF